MFFFSFFRKQTGKETKMQTRKYKIKTNKKNHKKYTNTFFKGHEHRTEGSGVDLGKVGGTN